MPRLNPGLRFFLLLANLGVLAAGEHNGRGRLYVEPESGPCLRDANSS